MTLYGDVWARYGSARGKAGIKAFVEGLRARMQKHGISQAALAKRAGFYPEHVSRWMNGHIQPDLEARLLLDEALDQLIAFRGDA